MLYKGVIQFIHDGMIFFYTVDALRVGTKGDTIGFYLDGNNIPRKIVDGSMYGCHCHNHFNGRYGEIEKGLIKDE